ncbi:DUF5071 domain-containing protein [Agarivorans gilvus]|uniref:DUF5071 domain-containing protein n=1 Tax=Agarivorans gilvus TaxID=680279 RepID=A0ABQ1I8B7_9ALTE|nr:DUF5071 domain-containing protein [Agarivorans gilvus]GGB21137.1 hypothetical protein GCM10007414_38150 [Agarivorans gilvus]
MIPSDKNDETSIRLLHLASDEDVLENAEGLLEWLHDVNWPVFGGVVTRLSPLGDHLVGPITKILEGSDSIWKANIVSHLIPAFSPESQQLYTKSLESILFQFDESDLREGTKGLSSVLTLNTLKKLNIQNYPNQNLESLSKMENLEQLYLTSRKLENLDGIEHLSKLKLLDLYNCPLLASLNGTEKCPKLKSIEIEACNRVCV